MERGDQFAMGQHNAICDRCGFKYKSRKLRLQWNNLRACSGAGTNNCWEPRHPQDFVKGRKDKQAPPWVRPEGEVIENVPGAPDWDEL